VRLGEADEPTVPAEGAEQDGIGRIEPARVGHDRRIADLAEEARVAARRTKFQQVSLDGVQIVRAQPSKLQLVDAGDSGGHGTVPPCGLSRRRIATRCYMMISAR
jgi:hypothetical protein